MAETVARGEPPAQPTTAALPSQLLLLGPIRFDPGYWQGMRQPAFLVPIQLVRLEVSAAAVRRFDEIVALACPGQADISVLLHSAVSRHPLLGRLLRMTLAVLHKMGMPVMGGATAIKAEAHNPSRWLVGLPAISESISAPPAAFRLACAVMNELAAGGHVQSAAVSAEVEKLIRHFRSMAPRGVNTLRFLQAAHDLDIPWRHVANNVYQFGWGNRSRWLDSSFTDKTSTISAGLARDKVACAKVLRDAGLPVPKHQLVATAEQAVKVADALGYPVVVKPSDLDGGRAVMAGVRTAEGVEKAFNTAITLSKRILVEQFIDGCDYRIRVCNGDVLGVMFRRPAAIVGDGISTVMQLIDRTNVRRSVYSNDVDPAVEQGAVAIQVDDEVEDWLAREGLQLSSIVPDGCRVRLRGAANWSLGGTVQDVISEAHPDNLALAVDAADALRLDVAGVDMLLPDIARSWKETGGAICEVNAQPQFSTTPTFKAVLQRLTPRRGRIPVVIICGGGSIPNLENDVVGLSRIQGIAVGWRVTVDTCVQAASDTQVAALIWAPERWPSVLDARPFDRADLVVKLGTHDDTQPPLGIEAVETWDIFEDAKDGLELAARLARWITRAARESQP